MPPRELMRRRSERQSPSGPPSLATVLRVELDKPRSLDLATERVLTDFLKSATDEDAELVLVALAAIGDGTWTKTYQWRRDFDRVTQFVVVLRMELVLAFRVHVAVDPDLFRLIHIGGALPS
jgi:hypothetical protein